jgi:hypothetical protein
MSPLEGSALILEAMGANVSESGRISSGFIYSSGSQKVCCRLVTIIWTTETVTL